MIEISAALPMKTMGGKDFSPEYVEMPCYLLKPLDGDPVLSSGAIAR